MINEIEVLREKVAALEARVADLEQRSEEDAQNQAYLISWLYVLSVSDTQILQMIPLAHRHDPEAVAKRDKVIDDLVERADALKAMKERLREITDAET